MAYSLELINVVTQTSGSDANVTTQPADNCHTLIIYNKDASNAVLVGIVPNGAGLTTSNATEIPAGGSLTLRIGTYEYRPFGQFTANTRLLRLKAAAGTPVVIFQFVNSVGNTAP